MLRLGNFRLIFLSVVSSHFEILLSASIIELLQKIDQREPRPGRRLPRFLAKPNTPHLWHPTDGFTQHNPSPTTIPTPAQKQRGRGDEHPDQFEELILLSSFGRKLIANTLVSKTV